MGHIIPLGAGASAEDRRAYVRYRQRLRLLLMACYFVCVVAGIVLLFAISGDIT